MEPRRSGDWRTLVPRAFAYIGPHRGSGLLILGLAVAGAVLGALKPLLFKYIFDGLAGEDAGRALVVGALMLLATYVAREVTGGHLEVAGPARAGRPRPQLVRLRDAVQGRGDLLRRPGAADAWPAATRPRLPRRR